MQISLYLAGKIKKSHEPSDEAYWRPEDLEVLRKAAGDIDLIFLDPATRTDDLTDGKSIFGRDMTQVYSSDIVLVDARDRRGLGVGAEMMWAKVNHLPVIALAPRETHYHKDRALILEQEVEGYIHPFVQELSDAIVGSLKEMGALIREFALKERAVKSREWIHETMRYYQETQLEGDHPMVDLFEEHDFLKERLMSIRQ